MSKLTGKKTKSRTARRAIFDRQIAQKKAKPVTK